MKKILLLLICLTTTQLFSQRFREIVKWEIATTNGGRIIGASINEKAADSVITDFATRNRGMNYGVVNFKKKHTTMSVVKKIDNPLQDIIDHTKRGYFVVTPDQVDILDRRGKKNVVETAIEFNDVSSINVADAINLIKLLEKYQIDGNRKEFLKTERLASN